MKLKQVSKWEELEGKTIKNVINSPVQVIIFTDDTFIVLSTEYESSQIELSSEATISELLSLGAISREEAEALRADERAAEQKKQKEYRRKQYLGLKKEFGNESIN